MAEENQQQTRNANKKAKNFDFEAIFKETIHSQQLRNVENQKKINDIETDDTTSESVEQKLAAVSIPSGDGSTDKPSEPSSTKEADGINNEEDDEDIGPALPPGFVPDKSVQIDTISTSNSDKINELDDEDITVSTLIPATFEANLTHGQRAVTAISFDSSGSKFVTGGENFAVQFFDFQKMDSSMKSFRESYPCESHVINSLAYSPNGENLIVASGDAQLKILDKVGKQWSETVKGDQYLVDIANTNGHTASVNHVTFHPIVKNEFLTCSDDGSLRLWSLDDHKSITKCINKQRRCIKTRHGGKKVIASYCCYSRDGKMIATGCTDGSLLIYKYGSFNAPKYINKEAHKGPICSLEFSPDGKKILTRSLDDTLKLFDIEKIKTPIHEVKDLDCMFIHTSCGYSPHGEFVFTTTSKREAKGKDSGSLLFFNSENLDLQYKIEYPNFGAVSCFWHPKLDQILVGFTNGTCKIYYDPKSSIRGALLCATKPVKRSRENEIVKEEMIIAPLALDMFQPRGEEGEEKEVTEWRIKRVLRMQSGKKKPQFKKPAEMPMSGQSAGGRLAKSGGTLHSYIAKELGTSKNQTFIQDEDIRASILRHAEAAEKEPLYINKAYKRTQPVPIFQEPDEDEYEPEYKVSKPNS